VADTVPPYVLQTQPAFRRCPSCARVYWRGTHWQGVEKKLGLVRKKRQPSSGSRETSRTRAVDP
jgi:hypothetical protein